MREKAKRNKVLLYRHVACLIMIRSNPYRQELSCELQIFR